MKFATQIQTIKSTRSPIYGPEGQLLSNQNHIHNSHNIYDWLIETYHGDYKKKKKNVERKKEKADLNKAADASIVAAKRHKSFSCRPSEIYCKTLVG